MMECQLHCLYGFRYFVAEAHKQRKLMLVSVMPIWVMCRGSNVKDKHVSAFQLESLILAQNERWRQA